MGVTETKSKAGCALWDLFTPAFQWAVYKGPQDRGHRNDSRHLDKWENTLYLCLGKQKALIKEETKKLLLGSFYSLDTSSEAIRDA